MTSGPVLIEPVFHEKIWGSTALAPWFPDSDRKIGEVWFPAGEVLVKFIFTSGRLSVQVHPDDEHARRLGFPAGKTEMWYILRAEPGARIALGFLQPLTRERLREAALSGEIERLLAWFPVAPGDVLFTPPGAVHAIGAGLALCEIQQNSDVTFRLYDYGRPRPLHLEQALQVARLTPHPGQSVPQELQPGVQLLAACDYFVTETLSFSQPVTCRPDAGRGHLLVVIEGQGELAGQLLGPGQVWRVPAGSPPFLLRPRAVLRLLRVFPPAA